MNQKIIIFPEKIWKKCNPFTRWVLVFLIIPIILTYILLRPQLKAQRISIPSPSEQTNMKIDVLTILPDSPLDELSQAWFGIPLKLDHYTLCLKNENEVETNGERMTLPSRKDTEVGAMEVSINHPSGVIDSIYAKFGDRQCKSLPIRNEIGKASTTVVFRWPKTLPLEVSTVEEEKGHGTLTLSGSIRIFSDKSYLEYHSILNEVLIKFMIILSGWIIFVVSCIESWRFMAKNPISDKKD